MVATNDFTEELLSGKGAVLLTQNQAPDCIWDGISYISCEELIVADETYVLAASDNP